MQRRVGDRRPPLLPPLPASGQVGVSITVLQPGSAISATNNSLVPDGSEIYRIAPDGTPLRLVALREDVVYALAVRNGALYAGSGNRGRVYRIDTTNAGAYTDIAHTEASQVTAMTQTPRRTCAGNSEQRQGAADLRRGGGECGVRFRCLRWRSQRRDGAVRK